MVSSFEFQYESDNHKLMEFNDNFQRYLNSQKNKEKENLIQREKILKAIESHNNSQIYKYLQASEHDFLGKNSTFCIYYAMKCQNIEALELFLSFGANPESMINYRLDSNVKERLKLLDVAFLEFKSIKFAELLILYGAKFPGLVTLDDISTVHFSQYQRDYDIQKIEFYNFLIANIYSNEKSTFYGRLSTSNYKLYDKVFYDILPNIIDDFVLKYNQLDEDKKNLVDKNIIKICEKSKSSVNYVENFFRFLGGKLYTQFSFQEEIYTLGKNIKFIVDYSAQYDQMQESTTLLGENSEIREFENLL